MDWQGIAGAAGAILAVCSAAAVGLTRAHVSNLRTMVDDQAKRIKFLEDRRGEDQLTIAGLGGEIAAEKERNGYLQTLVQGRVDWTAISDQLEAVHRLVVRIDRTVNPKERG